MTNLFVFPAFEEASSSSCYNDFMKRRSFYPRVTWASVVPETIAKFISSPEAARFEPKLGKTKTDMHVVKPLSTQTVQSACRGQILIELVSFTSSNCLRFTQGLKYKFFIRFNVEDAPKTVSSLCCSRKYLTSYLMLCHSECQPPWRWTQVCRAIILTVCREISPQTYICTCNRIKKQVGNVLI